MITVANRDYFHKSNLSPLNITPLEVSPPDPCPLIFRLVFLFGALAPRHLLAWLTLRALCYLRTLRRTLGLILGPHTQLFCGRFRNLALYLARDLN